MLESAPIGIALIEAPGTFRWANSAYFEVTGRGRDLLGRDFHEILESEGTWSAPIRAAVDAALSAGTPATFPAIRARYRGPSAPVYLDVDVRRVLSGAAGPIEVMLLIRDVTDRVAERDRATLFHAAFLGSTNAMQITDSDGIMVDVNPAFERIYGYSRAECIGRKPNLVRSRFTPAEVYEHLWKDLKDPERGYWSGEILNRDRQGHEHPVLLSITAIRDSSGKITDYLGISVDRTEQRDWEMASAHLERLSSLGQLAAGIAHEINTPLANVMLIAESLRRRVKDPELSQRVGAVQDQVEVAARIVRSLLDFARREEPKRADVDLAEVAREAVRFVEGKRTAEMEYREELPPEGLPVQGDRGQLTQVVTNLLNNAFDAQKGMGRILVRGRRNGRWAELEVVDSGPGIPAEVLPHLFEPFYTTKPEGEGTGLGLAICHGIVQSHHGSIRAQNAENGGASFVVALPLREPSSEPRS
jgi:two-component system, cell cycle sensor histidine kinase and response regulator CckA